MNAVLYLFARQQVNNIKRIFSKPGSAIITVFVVIFFIACPVMAIINPGTGIKINYIECFAAAIPLFLGLFLLNTFLSQKSGLYTLSDACFLFVSPVSTRQVIFYAILQSAPGSLLTAVFLSFYFPALIGNRITGVGFIAILFEMTLFFCCIYLSYYCIYIADTAKPGTAKRVKAGLWIFIAAVVLIFGVVLWKKSFSVISASVAFFSSPIYSALPVFGWVKWGIMSVINGRYLTGYLPATLLLAAFSALIGYLMINIKSEFYEQALEDSYKVQKIIGVRKGNVDQRSVFKVRKTRASVKFGLGASAIFSKQWLEMKKTSPVVTMKELLIGVLYSVFALFIGMDFYFTFFMILFMSLAATLNDSWHMDFKKPYVYLIPDSSFKKIVFSVLAGFIKSVASGTISIIVAAVLFQENPLDTAAYILIFAAFSALFVSAEVVAYRIMGNAAGVPALMFLRMLFVMISMVPSGIILVIMLIVSNGSLSVMEIAPVLIIVNAALSALLLFCSRRLFEQSELMN